ncbi:hypothetical protein ISN44_As05g049360, partial [Arabidopsis suecica]
IKTCFSNLFRVLGLGKHPSNSSADDKIVQALAEAIDAANKKLRKETLQSNEEANDAMETFRRKTNEQKRLENEKRKQALKDAKDLKDLAYKTKVENKLKKTQPEKDRAEEEEKDLTEEKKKDPTEEEEKDPTEEKKKEPAEEKKKDPTEEKKKDPAEEEELEIKRISNDARFCLHDNYNKCCNSRVTFIGQFNLLHLLKSSHLVSRDILLYTKSGEPTF